MLYDAVDICRRVTKPFPSRPIPPHPSFAPPALGSPSLTSPAAASPTSSSHLPSSASFAASPIPFSKSTPTTASPPPADMFSPSPGSQPFEAPPPSSGSPPSSASDTLKQLPSPLPPLPCQSTPSTQDFPLAPSPDLEKWFLMPPSLRKRIKCDVPKSPFLESAPPLSSSSPLSPSSPLSSSPPPSTPRVKTRIRLYCIPQAGMGAWVYNTWADRLAKNGIQIVPIELPGRNSRMKEPCETDLRVLARRVASAIAMRQIETSKDHDDYCSEESEEVETLIGHDEKGPTNFKHNFKAGYKAANDDGIKKQRGRQKQVPYALYGHSMGSWIAFEVAKALESHVRWIRKNEENEMNTGVTNPSTSTKRKSDYNSKATTSQNREETTPMSSPSNVTLMDLDLQNDASPDHLGAVDLPLRLFVSGMRAPHLSGPDFDLDRATRQIHSISDPEEFWIAFTRRYGHNPSLDDPRLRRLMLPIFKADFRAVETYKLCPQEDFKKTENGALSCNTLSIPISAIGADLDPRCNQEQIGAWSRYSCVWNINDSMESGNTDTERLEFRTKSANENSINERTIENVIETSNEKRYKSKRSFFDMFWLKGRGHNFISEGPDELLDFVVETLS